MVRDPAFVPPPAPAVKYAARCGRRNVEGVGARVSGFRAGEAQFGEVRCYLARRWWVILTEHARSGRGCARC